MQRVNTPYYSVEQQFHLFIINYKWQNSTARNQPSFPITFSKKEHGSERGSMFPVTVGPSLSWETTLAKKWWTVHRKPFKALKGFAFFQDILQERYDKRNNNLWQNIPYGQRKKKIWRTTKINKFYTYTKTWDYITPTIDIDAGTYHLDQSAIRFLTWRILFLLNLLCHIQLQQRQPAL